MFHTPPRPDSLDRGPIREIVIHIKRDDLVKSRQSDGCVKSSPPEADRWIFYTAIKYGIDYFELRMTIHRFNS
jgi:hypothetical protein